MPTLAELLGLVPRRKGRVSRAAALAAARRYADTQGERTRLHEAGRLTWDEAGEAVWRFQLSGPVEGAPVRFVDIDAATGEFKRAPVPAR